MNKTVEVMAMGTAPEGLTLSIHNAREAVKSRYSPHTPLTARPTSSPLPGKKKKELKENDAFRK